MRAAIYWFRNDLRLEDNPALVHACAECDQLLPVFCHPDPDEPSDWGFARVGAHRRHFLHAALNGLHQQLLQLGSGLVQLGGDAVDQLSQLATAAGIERIYCEEIAAPEERAVVRRLRERGLQVCTSWQSTLFDADQLPFPIAQLPEQYTRFRLALEGGELTPPAPLPAPERLPPLPVGARAMADQPRPCPAPPPHQPRSAYPYRQSEFEGCAAAAQAHLQRYFQSGLPATYKATRNQLIGIDYSTKFSPWLANGALSVRSVYAALGRYEQAHGRNDGSYWIWFELLWREHFRWLHRKHGIGLYRACGLNRRAGPPEHRPECFRRWCQGRSGDDFVDAGMRELAASGYLSNRMRQVVASYLIHELRCDHRAGAAWFEAQLIDYDVYSNQGNWLYLAGRGTDPRGGRQFNPDKQARHYDPDRRYRDLWSQP